VSEAASCGLSTGVAAALDHDAAAELLGFFAHNARPSPRPDRSVIIGLVERSASKTNASAPDSVSCSASSGAMRAATDAAVLIFSMSYPRRRR